MDGNSDAIEFGSAIGTFFKVTVSTVFIISLAFIFAFALGSGGIRYINLIVGAVLLFMTLFLIASWRTTRYVLTADGVEIRGLFRLSMLEEHYLENVVRYETILRITETRDVSYSIAFSFDALRIEYSRDGKKDAFVISPERKDEFLRELAHRTDAEITRS